MCTHRNRRIRRFLSLIPLKRFRKNKSGTTAVEFGFIALPFLALLFAIIETGLVFLAGQVLETAVADSARLILTGQAQAAKMDQAKFKNEVCARIKGLFDCQGGVYIDVRQFSSFSGINFAPPVDANGNLNDNFTYQPGGPGEIIVVRLMYQFPVTMQLWNPSLVNVGGTKHLLIATAAFRNEPF